MKKIIWVLVVYMILLGAFVGYKITSGGSNYFGYKKDIQQAQEKLKSTQSKGEDSKAKQDTSDSSKSATVATTTASSATTATQVASATPTQTTNADANKQAQSADNTASDPYANVDFSNDVLSTYSTPSKEIGKIQSFLHSKGLYDGTISEKYDEATKLAVKKYQQSKGLTNPDGICGQGTKAVLKQDMKK